MARHHLLYTNGGGTEWGSGSNGKRLAQLTRGVERELADTTLR